MPLENPRIREFAALMGEICPRALVAPGKNIRWTLVINPSAGGFTIRSRWIRHRAALEDYAKKARANPRRDGCGPAVFGWSAAAGEGGPVLTAGAGDAEGALRSLLETAAEAGEQDFFLVVTAGGDGTSLEVQSALYHAPAALRERFAVLRLPMGTGNDGADSQDLAGALDLLIKPVDIVKAQALRLSTARPGKGPFLAFNILSVGLDAFVTHMTNKMKGNLPGDSYKLWVDIAALFYDRIYTVGPLDLRALDREGREVAEGTFRRHILLLAVGASGRRTYGSRKRILPDDRNVCALKQMSLLRKLALKDLFNTGAHVDKPEAILFNAARVEFSGLHPILAQMDGETVLLRPEDFPAAIELTPPAIPVLKPRNGLSSPG
ncbi:MAG: diacylglycerol kinase [Treponema sp.]|jgi:diacylglycerol kinase family enzyme|nr:diacylglycerol kinase [Treponema sp.]